LLALEPDERSFKNELFDLDTIVVSILLLSMPVSLVIVDWRLDAMLSKRVAVPVPIDGVKVNDLFAGL
jgi:hypothetical protein